MEINEVILLTDKLSAVKHFYTAELGLAVIKASQNEISFAAGTSVLTFKQSAAAAYYHFAFNIVPGLFHQAHAWAQQRFKLLAFENNTIIHFPNWNANSLYFMDPSGNILEFIARYDLPSLHKNVFDTSCILNISEIGIVTDPVSATKQLLEDNFGLSVFHRQQPTEEFCPMGDDSGLLIVVTQHRNWFPTRLPCRPYPVKVKFTNNEGNSLLFSVH